MAPGYYVGGYASGHPVMLPVIDVVEVGAGGGSIAWIDDVGALKVGPQSAGADPGPDLLSRRRHRADHHRRQRRARPARPEELPRRRRWSSMPTARARGIEDKIAKPLGMDPVTRRRRPFSRSRSPRCRSRCARCRSRRATTRAISCWSPPAAPVRCTSCAIARELHIPTVIVPLFPSHFSALGMLLADERHDFIRTFYADLGATRFRRDCCAVHDEMAAEAKTEPAARAQRRVRQIQLDLRYVGQEFTLAGAGDAGAAQERRPAAIRTAFDALYEQRYAHHSPDEPVEMVNIRLAAIGKRPQAEISRASARGEATARRVADATSISATRDKPVSCPIYQRERARRRSAHQGPGADRGARHHDRALRTTAARSRRRAN